MQRVGSKCLAWVRRRSRRPREGLGDRLAAEHAVEAVGLGGATKAVGARRAEIEDGEEAIEGHEDPIAERGRTSACYHAVGRCAPADTARDQVDVLQDEKILITGPAGRIAFGLARSLAPTTRCGASPGSATRRPRDKVEALGVTTRAIDIADGDFGDLPTDFTYLLHIAADFSADDYDRALRVNAEGTGFLLEHCRDSQGGAGDVDGHRLQAAPRPVARVPRGRSAR